jgi:hypothetical protein
MGGRYSLFACLTTEHKLQTFRLAGNKEQKYSRATVIYNFVFH